MTLKISIDPAYPERCRLWIDLLIYPTPRTENERESLGLTEEQLTFAQTLVFQSRYPNTITALYYLGCSIRVRDFIPRTLAKVTTAKMEFDTIDALHEDDFYRHTPKNFDVRHLIPERPEGVVVSMTNAIIGGERITIHRNLLTPQHLVEYQYENENGYHLMKRVDRLMKHTDATLVTNIPRRQRFNLSMLRFS